jgi:hypothetical protein
VQVTWPQSRTAAARSKGKPIVGVSVAGCRAFFHYSPSGTGIPGDRITQRRDEPVDFPGALKGRGDMSAGSAVGPRRRWPSPMASPNTCERSPPLLYSGAGLSTSLPHRRRPPAFYVPDRTASRGAEGNETRSALASCRPCAIARSSQYRASATFSSPANSRARNRPSIICARG